MLIYHLKQIAGATLAADSLKQQLGHPLSNCDVYVVEAIGNFK